MQLEQWEIDLMDQIGENKKLKTKNINDTKKSFDKEEYLYYSSVFLFFFLAILFFVDLKFNIIEYAFIKKTNNFYTNEEKLEIIREVINYNFSNSENAIVINEDWSVEN